jgi:hypothetical protein
MVRCDRGSRWAGSIRGGDHADPAQPVPGVMTSTIRTRREDRAVHAAPVVVGAGRQWMW